MTKLLLLIFGGLKLGKVLMSAGTMLASIAVYALFYGWRFAAGFVALLLVHEAGHYVAAQRRGLDVGLPTFIPFVGTLGALACYAAARHYDSNLLLALAYTGFFLNLFNMIPLSPFDGGRITAVLSPRIWFAGVPVLIALFAYRPSPLLIVMAILALPQLKRAWRYDPDAPENRAYYTTSVETKTTYALFYVGLLAFLALMTSGVHDMLRVAHSAA
ncbi:site-2 protease family protein [Burkholderia diffusa]|uniref:Peptidase M50 n=1 Tax=Burkholderia diffusa TaxID=488732 RepID=A0A6P2JJ98_9BURK|nr:site-2 protease family protein [Burkholderia diffusa]KAB0661442.1 site-2 protease family protein [Burkholderia diffusa]MBM2653570.1 site-2 protease family protein [Burkholderia diffusa]VWB42857.1 peptidase M50 [Burkholderia diffusa]